MKPGKDEYSGLSAGRCSVSPGGDRTEGLILSDEASMCSPEHRRRTMLHLDTWDLMSLHSKARGQPVKSTS